MRVPGFLILVVALGVLLAGCFGGDPAPEAGEGTAAEETATAPVLPENFTREESVVAATPLSGLISTTSCGDVASGTCYRYAVNLEDPARMTATLSWETPTNDFDLILLQDGAVLERSDMDPPGTKETLMAALEPGTYDLMVVAYIVSVDTFHLEAVFTSV